jgi:putative aldouronate transport system substrate-binding protein
MQQLIRQEPWRVGSYTADHFAMGIDLNNSAANQSIIALPPVAGPGGARWQPGNNYADGTTGFCWLITDKAQDPEACFKLGDSMLDMESGLARRFGIEGTGWGRFDTPVESMLGGEAHYWVNTGYGSDDDATSAEKNSLWIPPFNDLADFRADWNPMPTNLFVPESYEARLFIETTKCLPYIYPEFLPKKIGNYIDDPDEQASFMDIQTTLVSFIKTSMTQFITGEKDLDKDWDSFQGELGQYQGKEYLRLYQKYYDIYKGMGA